MPDERFDPIRTRYSQLARLKDWGDQTSWQEFFDTYWRLIYNVAVKAGLTDIEAQEVVQETVIAVAKKIGEFKADPAHGSFGAWLMQMTRWRISDQWRKGGIDLIIDRQVDVAIDQVRGEESWTELVRRDRKSVV